MAEASAIEGGFARPVFAAQATFRAAMDALAHPGRAYRLAERVVPPAPLTAELGALALTLCDHDTPLWLDPALTGGDAVSGWLRFQTGAPFAADPADAAFALAAGASALPRLADFAQGTDEYPDRSTTILLAVEVLEGGPPLILRGPGICDQAAFAPVGLPEDFVVQWAENRTQFPRGVDLLLVAPGAVVGLPRTTRISLGEA
jgi:alpha-D-ribose 1-methylphosphonate 5-triphosphate synthase subunit PhnH